MNDTPTQVEHSWRAAARTVFQALVALSVVAVPITEATGVDQTLPWVVAFLAITGGITRVMAIPGVNAWIERFVPWLAAAPKT